MSNLSACHTCGYEHSMFEFCKGFKPRVKDKYINPVLNERESTHGDYAITAQISQRLKQVLVSSDGYTKLSQVQAESLDMICTKIARAISGDPDCKDTWDDIAGYANLVSERLP